MSKKWIVVSMIIASLVLAACGATETPAAEPTDTPRMEEPTESPMASEAEVAMRDVTFQPGEITISPGTTVIWTNEDSAPHTVTSGTRDNPTDLFDSGNLGGGESFSFTFDEPGTYEYFCSIHPGMDGTVIVEE